MGAKQSATKYQSVDNYQNNKTEEPTNTNRVTLDEAYDSLEDYKQCINNVYCLNKILDDLIEELNEQITQNDDNPINSVLLGTLHDDYDKDSAITFCEIMEIARTPSEVGNCRLLFSCKKYEEIDGLSLNALKTANTPDKIDNMSYSNVALLLEQRIVEMSKKIPAYGKIYLHSGFSMWSEGVKNYFNLVRKHPIDNNKWIVISSGVNMNKYTKANIYNLSTFSYEYKMLMENITQVMNSNTYLNIIEDSLEDAQITAENAIKDSEEKTALYNFAQKVYNNAPNDPYAINKLQQAKIEAQNASRFASSAVTNAKAAQYSLTEAETSIATKTTTWEYGLEDNYDNLRCIYSGIHPQWNGLLIKDCRLHGSSYNISEVTLSVMTDITHYYPELFNGQTILTSYRTDHGSHIAIVKVIKHGEDVHIQLKEANLDLLFGVKNEQMRTSTSKEQLSQSKPPNSSISSSDMNNSHNRSHIFIDPSVYFIGIGTNERIVKYTSSYVTTKPNNIQHVVVKSDAYPNFVSSRKAEQPRHIKDENYYYIDQFSASTMRRESDLYSFSDMMNLSNDASDKEGYEKKYGTDISFELTDKTKSTTEIGNIGMVIDKIDEEGRVHGGLSVKTLPKIETINGKTITKPGATIMYVSSEGLLHVSGIMLGENMLYVNEDEEGEQNLYWGDKKIM